MRGHRRQMTGYVNGREVEKRVDWTDCAVEETAQAEVGHVCKYDLRALDTVKALLCELDHPRRNVDTDNIQPAPRKCFNNAARATAWLEHAPALVAQTRV